VEIENTEQNLPDIPGSKTLSCMFPISATTNASFVVPLNINFTHDGIVETFNVEYILNSGHSNLELGYFYGNLECEDSSADLTKMQILFDNDMVANVASDGSYHFACNSGDQNIAFYLEGYKHVSFYYFVETLGEHEYDRFFRRIPTPNNLELEQNNNSIILTWNQEEYDDMWSFEKYYIYRNKNDILFELIDSTYTESYTEQIDLASNYQYYVETIFEEGTSYKSNIVNYNLVSGDDIIVPKFTELIGSYPNPFVKSADRTNIKIKFALHKKDKVNLSVYNIKGQKVASIYNDDADVGVHEVIWNGKDQYGKSTSSGIYFYKMQTSEKVQCKKLLLLK
jgi:hypothetical protein